MNCNVMSCSTGVTSTKYRNTFQEFIAWMKSTKICFLNYFQYLFSFYLFSLYFIQNISILMVSYFCTDYRKPYKELTSLMKRKRHLVTKYHNIRRGRRSMTKWCHLRNSSMLLMITWRRIVYGWIQRCGFITTFESKLDGRTNVIERLI